MKSVTRRHVPWQVRVAAFIFFTLGLGCVALATYAHRLNGFDARVIILGGIGAGLFVMYWKLLFVK